MAGDWIKMRVDLADDPAVIAIAERLGLDEFAVVGRLHAFWSWADRQSRDGHAGVTHAWLDRYLRCDGFAAAMVAAGWLIVVGDDGLSIPKFDRHNGQTAKARALTTNRKRAQRGHAVVTPASRSDRDASVTRTRARVSSPPFFSSPSSVNEKDSGIEKPPKKERARKKRAAGPPPQVEGWTPSVKTLAAAQKHFPNVDLEFEETDFRNWIGAPKYAGRYSDFDRAFWNHLKKANREHHDAPAAEARASPAVPLPRSQPQRSQISMAGVGQENTNYEPEPG